MKYEAQEVMDKMIEDFNKQPLKFAMQPTKITFEQLFPTGVYQNERLSIEIQLNDEDPIEAFKRARSLVQQAFHAMNPGIYDQTGTTITPVEEPVVSKSEQVSGIMEAISLCRSTKALEMFRAAMEREKKEFPKIEVIFNKKMQELNNQ